jgi:hypothetical protein
MTRGIVRRLLVSLTLLLVNGPPDHEFQELLGQAEPNLERGHSPVNRQLADAMIQD